MKTIILIEDDSAIRESFTLVFSSPDVNVISFENGEKILQNKVEAPDLFILDKNIGGTNGADLCRFIKSSFRYRQTPVVLLSASPSLEQLAEESGADGFIEKPFRLKTIREIISKHIS